YSRYAGYSSSEVTMPDMPTGQLIRLYRIDRRKSTVSVATLAGITVRYLEMIEAGTKTPTLHVLRKIRCSACVRQPCWARHPVKITRIR
ncbi:MAG: helix-turn-helix domain-containing protein, partial [Actinomycetota bacterium]|nr:helix-turn-helix domain-containing protein [Actinomycetota bacterium]